MRAALESSETRFMGRDAVRLSNGSFRATIQREGGMGPELGLEREEGFLNLHWLPPFREPAGLPWSAEKHGPFWKSRLLYTIAGSFLCSPNFGPGCSVEGVDLPAHGWTANGLWTLEGHGADRAGSFAYADFSMASPSPAMPLVWDRRDFLVPGQDALFTSVLVRNPGKRPLAINLAHHNTIGAPFLGAGCRISLCAERFMAAPTGTEFDDTGRLAQGVEFASLAEAPLRKGGAVDISRVPGMIGYTDLLTGAIPERASLGWSCVLNPRLSLAYLCFFPGPLGLPAGEIALSFNDLWMQYGGRRFTPWAEREGGEDRTFCLGTENAVGAFANGLDYSRGHPALLGRPTLVEIPAGGARVLHYAAAVLRVGPGLARAGIERVEAEGDRLVLGGGGASEGYPLSADFGMSRRLTGVLPGWAS